MRRDLDDHDLVDYVALTVLALIISGGPIYVLVLFPSDSIWINMLGVIVVFTASIAIYYRLLLQIEQVTGFMRYFNSIKNISYV